MTLKIGSLFTGYGGLDMAVHAVFGDAETVWVSDIDKGASKILAHRYPAVPNLGDITRIDWTQVEPVDILTGGFPCQDVSHAGKRAGLKDGTRSGLWSHMAEAVRQLQPSLVVAENVRGLLSAASPSDVEPCPWCVGDEPVSDLRALGAVLADLADIGYDARWCGLRAADVGSCHGRFRVFLIAYPTGDPWRFGNGDDVCDGRGTVGREPTTGGGSSETQVTLLPTPVVNDMGAGKTPSEWSEWSEWSEAMKARHGNGNGHGASLSIEAQRLLPTPTRRDHKDGPKVEAVDENALLGRVVWELVERFGDYAPAVERWEQVTGREAPSPTDPTGRDQAHRLSAGFVEWMMGLPDGWITGTPGITRNESLKALGNGVVPQQAAAALRHLLEEL